MILLRLLVLKGTWKLFGIFAVLWLSFMVLAAAAAVVAAIIRTPATWPIVAAAGYGGFVALQRHRLRAIVFTLFAPLTHAPGKAKHWVRLARRGKAIGVRLADPRQDDVVLARGPTRLAGIRRGVVEWDASVPPPGDWVWFTPSAPIPPPGRLAPRLVAEGGTVTSSDRIILGRGRGGIDIGVDLVEDNSHALFGGRSGMGKSNGLRVAVRSGLAAAMEAVIIDLKGGRDFVRFEGHAGVRTVVYDFDAAARVVETMLQEVKDRSKAVREAVRAGRPEPSFPRLLFIIDELRVFYGEAKRAKRLDVVAKFEELVLLARSARVSVLAGAQRFDVKASMGGAARDQFGVRQGAGRMRRAAADMFYEELAAEANELVPPSATRGRGVLVVGDDIFPIQVDYCDDPPVATLTEEMAPPTRDSHRNDPDTPTETGSETPPETPTAVLGIDPGSEYVGLAFRDGNRCLWATTLGRHQTEEGTIPALADYVLAEIAGLWPYGRAVMEGVDLSRQTNDTIRATLAETQELVDLLTAGLPGVVVVKPGRFGKGAVPGELSGPRPKGWPRGDHPKGDRRNERAAYRVAGAEVRSNDRAA